MTTSQGAIAPRDTVESRSAYETHRDESGALPRVLCVDDEPAVLRATRRVLARHFDVTMAAGGLAALDAVRHAKIPFAAVVSDLRMPELNGIGLLQCVRQHAPETARVLLTGNADVAAAVDAVNAGEVFRFLTKPCPPESLIEAVNAACAQYRRMQATPSRERQSETPAALAAHQTVKAQPQGSEASTGSPRDIGYAGAGAVAATASKQAETNEPETSTLVVDDPVLLGYIEVLRAVLADVRPSATSCAARIEHRVAQVLDAVHLSIADHVKTAAVLSQLGSTSLAQDVAERIYGGWALSADDRACAARIRPRSADLLVGSPSLALVRRILVHQTPGGTETSGSDASDHETLGPGDFTAQILDELELGARILDIALMLDDIERRAADPDKMARQVTELLAELESRPSKHDGLLVDSFRIAMRAPSDERLRTIRLREAHGDMVLAADVVAPNGLLVARRGQRIGEILAKRTTASWSAALLDQSVQVTDL